MPIAYLELHPPHASHQRIPAGSPGAPWFLGVGGCASASVLISNGVETPKISCSAM